MKNTTPQTATRVTAIQWLRENGYEDIANMIEEIVREWRSKGKKTRRNWWDSLAGDAKGNPRKVAGRAFPVLKVAQRRQGCRVTKNAVSRKRGEKAPMKWVDGRWKKVDQEARE